MTIVEHIQLRGYIEEIKIRIENISFGSSQFSAALNWGYSPKFFTHLVPRGGLRYLFSMFSNRLLSRSFAMAIGFTEWLDMASQAGLNGISQVVTLLGIFQPCKSQT